MAHQLLPTVAVRALGWAVQGTGPSAWMREELLRGSSGLCDTFASPCLASREESGILAVELWHVH